MDLSQTEVEVREPVELKKLSPRHMQVAALVAQGIPRATIAAACDYVPEYITWLQGQPLFIEYIKTMNKAMGTQLEAMFAQSVTTIADAMTNGTVDERLKGAKLQLEATGRIGRFATIAPQASGEDSLQLLSERLLTLLQKQRRTVDGEVPEEAVILTEQKRLPIAQTG